MFIKVEYSQTKRRIIQKKQNTECGLVDHLSHCVRKALASRSRNLHVKNLTWVFDKARVFQEYVEPALKGQKRKVSQGSL